MQASGPIDDRVLISQFCECMDPVTKKIIEAKRAENSALSFADIFADVDAKFTKSARNTSRAKLESLSLKNSSGGRLNLRDYESFDAEFRILRSECPEIGEDEAKRLYQKALPLFLIEFLQKDLLKKEKHPRAFFAGHTEFTATQVKQWLEHNLATNFGRVTLDNGGFWIQCQDQAQLTQLLALNGRALANGKAISVKATDIQLSLEEMRQICRESLQPHENAVEIKYCGTSPSQKQAPRQSQVAVLEGDEAMSMDDDGGQAEIAAVAPQHQNKRNRTRRSRGSSNNQSGKGSASSGTPPPPPVVPPPPLHVASSAAPPSGIEVVQSQQQAKTPTQEMASVKHEVLIHVKNDTDQKPKSAENWNRGGGNYNSGGGQNWNRNQYNPNGENWDYNRVDYQHHGNFNPYHNNWHGQGGNQGNGNQGNGNQGKGNQKGGKGKGKGKGKGGQGNNQPNQGSGANQGGSGGSGNQGVTGTPTPQQQ